MMRKIAEYKKYSLWLLLLLIVIGVAFLYSSKFYVPKKRVAESNSSSSSSPTSLVNSPEFTVNISNITFNPNSEPKRFNFDVEVKNYSVEPFITSYSFENCKMSFGDKGKEISLRLGGAIEKLSKAILPGEIYMGKLRNLDVVINEKNCIYDDKGIYVCEPLDNLQIIQCDVYVSNSEKSPQGGFGVSSKKVSFPNK